MNWTLDEIFSTIAQTRARRKKKTHASALPCHCGMNPLQTYFTCLESVFDEFIVENFSDGKNPGFTDAALIIQDIKNALAVVSAREVEQFCSVCQHRMTLGNVPSVTEATTPAS